MPWFTHGFAVALALAVGLSGAAGGRPPDLASGRIGEELRAPPAAGKRVLGYYVPYDPTSWETLAAQSGHLDDVAVQWVTIDPCGRLGSRDNRTLVAHARANGVRVLPSLLTSSGWLNDRILNDDAVASEAIGQIVSYVTSEGYEGFDLDFEGIRPDDRAAYTTFVGRLAAALHEHGKTLAIAIPAKPAETFTGWAGAYDYAGLGQHADLVTIMAYEFRGAWSGPGSVAPYEWVERVAAYATSQIPPEKVLLGLAFYGYDWNVTSGAARPLSYGQAARLAAHHGVPIVLDEVTQSATFQYQAPAGAPTPAGPAAAPLHHEIAVREPPPCDVAPPPLAPTPTPRPAPPPGTIQQHEVWLEEAAGVAARLGLATRHGAGGVAAWRLGIEDPRTWTEIERWRAAGP